jgi:hypothetical protein
MPMELMNKWMIEWMNELINCRIPHIPMELMNKWMIELMN